MKVSYWFDYACPYCYIGTHAFKRAVRELGADDVIDLEPKAFRLNRTEVMGPIPPISCREYFKLKNGLSEEETDNQMGKLNHMAQKEGLTLNYATAPLIDTIDALRLTKYAYEHGGTKVSSTLYTALCRAYLIYNMDISDHSILLSFALEAGVDKAGAVRVLTSDDYGADVLSDEIKGDISGVHVIPDYMAGGEHIIRGIRPYDEVKKAIAALL